MEGIVEVPVSRFSIQQKLLKDALQVVLDYKNVCPYKDCEACVEAKQILDKGKELFKEI